MARKTLLLATLLALLAPLAMAQDNDTDVPDQIDVDMDVTDNDGAEESTFAGLSTTVVIILIVLAVLVVALIVAMASRP